MHGSAPVACAPGCLDNRTALAPSPAAMHLLARKVDSFWTISLFKLQFGTINLPNWLLTTLIDFDRNQPELIEKSHLHDVCVCFDLHVFFKLRPTPSLSGGSSSCSFATCRQCSLDPFNLFEISRTHPGFHHHRHHQHHFGIEQKDINYLLTLTAFVTTTATSSPCRRPYICIQIKFLIYTQNSVFFLSTVGRIFRFLLHFLLRLLLSFITLSYLLLDRLPLLLHFADGSPDRHLRILRSL